MMWKVKVFVPLQEWTLAKKDHLVSLKLLTVITCQGDISKVIVFAEQLIVI